MGEVTVIRNPGGPRVVVRHKGIPGADGIQGASGEVTSATSVSVNNEVVLFNGTSGIDIKRSNVLITDLATTTDLGNKVDKVVGKGLSTEDFSTALKNKLTALSSGTFRGTYDDETALTAGIPTGNEGDYAYVVSPIPNATPDPGEEQILYIWDVTNAVWTKVAPGSAPVTGAEVSARLFAEANTNNYDDVEKTKVANSVSQATFDSVIQTLTGGAAPTTNVVTDATTSRTLTPTDVGKFIVLTSGSPCTIVVQDDVTALWTLSPPISFYVSNAVPIVDPDPGVTVSDPSGILAALVTGSTFTLKKIGADAWVVVVGM